MNSDTILKLWKNTEVSSEKCSGCAFLVEVQDPYNVGGSPMHLECELDHLIRPAYEQCPQVQEMMKGLGV